MEYEKILEKVIALQSYVDDKIKFVEEKFNEHIRTSKDYSDEINTVKIDVGIIKVNIDNVNKSVDRVEKSVNKLEDTIKNLSDKPGKRWDNLVNTTISLVVGAAIAFVAAKAK